MLHAAYHDRAHSAASTCLDQSVVVIHQEKGARELTVNCQQAACCLCDVAALPLLVAFPAGLKDVIPDSAGKVGGVIKDILPLPGFLKK
jgi:hypothetical protein